jgi:hypothetical protein
MDTTENGLEQELSKAFEKFYSSKVAATLAAVHAEMHADLVSEIAKGHRLRRSPGGIPNRPALRQVAGKQLEKAGIRARPKRKRGEPNAPRSDVNVIMGEVVDALKSKGESMKFTEIVEAVKKVGAYSPSQIRKAVQLGKTEGHVRQIGARRSAMYQAV